MNRNVGFLLVLFFLSTLLESLYGQLPANISILNKSIPQLLEGQSKIVSPFLGFTIKKMRETPPLWNDGKLSLKPSPFNGVNARPMAFFCKIEVILEKKNGVPIKFRLGDIDKVDQLEGKFSW